jgi:hypothetical protein
MKNITLTFLTTAAIGAVSIGGASAMPFNNVSAALGESHVQNVRVVCDQYQRCYNTGRAYRSARPYYAPRYNMDPPGMKPGGFVVAVSATAMLGCGHIEVNATGATLRSAVIRSKADQSQEDETEPDDRGRPLGHRTAICCGIRMHRMVRPSAIASVSYQRRGAQLRRRAARDWPKACGSSNHRDGSSGAPYARGLADCGEPNRGRCNV